MARLPRAVIDEFTADLNSLSVSAKRISALQLSSIEYTDVADLREKVIAILEPLCAASTDMAAAIAAELYDLIREYETGLMLGAEAMSMRDPAATGGAIKALVQVVVDGGPLEELFARLQERIDFEIKRAAGECVKANAAKDPLRPKWARIPSGIETCPFCLMLASRGFVYSSDKAAGSEGHYHPNCDCRIVPGFSGDTSIEGYEPDALYEQWKASSHAEYMERRASGHRNRSTYKIASSDGLPSFDSFSDVKAYLYEAESEADLERRFSVLGNVYGFGSQQMRSTSLKNVVKTATKKLDR